MKRFVFAVNSLFYWWKGQQNTKSINGICVASFPVIAATIKSIWRHGKIYWGNCGR